ncbi:Translocase of chloroplast 159, chloroplastic [Geodia barretti]|uniref:Translocase of chloroplast 159, chloroplastic n=1 Tax=Geodia barretti TaxID=519541 RepID=A0AA35WWF0_GEOBA|nr:Translocase of chloroplast 159, chloroplastic [Geodia barretti]
MAESADVDLYDTFAQLPDERISQELLEWFKKSNEVKIFITGKTGVGKSTLVNGLVGKQVAKEGDSLDPETSIVKDYKCKHRSVYVTVWDSPGLQDGTNKEGKYLEDMKKKCSDVDLSIYCVDFKETRFFPNCPDILAMKKLTKLFGEKMWENAMFVLTFANLAEDLDSKILEADEDEEKARLFQNKVELWKRALADALIADVGVDKEVAERIEVVPAGHESIPALLDRPHWLSPIWFAALYAMHPRAQPAMLKLNRHRIVDNPKQIRDEDLKKFIDQQPLIFSQRGALIGEKYGESELGQAIGCTMGSHASVDLKVALQIRNTVTELAKRYGQAFIDMIRDIFS